MFNKINTLAQTLCSFAALIVAIIALAVASNTYKHSAITFNADIDIQKNGNIITIKNNDTDIFDIYNVAVEGVDAYWCQMPDVQKRVDFSTFFYLRDEEDADKPNLNNLEIDTTIIHQSYGNEIELSEQKRFKDNLQNAIYNLSDIGISADYEETIYYMNITYYNKHDFNAKTLTLRCSVGKDGNFNSIVPCETTYRERENFFDLLHSKSRFKGKWIEVTEWLKEQK